MRGFGTILQRVAVERAQRPISRPASSQPHNARNANWTLEARLADYRDTYGYIPTWVLCGFLSLSGAWRASKMLTDLLGGTPFQEYRAMPDKSTVRVPTRPLLDYPEGEGPNKSRMNTHSSLGLDLMWRGSAICLVASRDSLGYPNACLAVPVDRVGVGWLDPTGYIPYGAKVYQVGNLIFDEVDVIHFMGMHEPGALRGLGILETQRPGLTLAREQMDQALSVITQSGVPTGYLTTDDVDTTPAQLKAAKEDWLTSQRRRTIAALGPTVRFEAVAWNPQEGQMIEARQFSLTEQENMLELPHGWLGGSTSPKQYSNLEAEIRDLQRTSWLAGAYARFEETYSSHMPHGRFAKANLDAALRGDTRTRYEAHALAIGPNGWAVRDEVRAIEDLEPLGGEDGNGAAWKTKAAKPVKPAPIQATATVGDATKAIDGSATE